MSYKMKKAVYICIYFSIMGEMAQFFGFVSRYFRKKEKQASRGREMKYNYKNVDNY